MLLLLSPGGLLVAGSPLGRFWRVCPIDCRCSSSSAGAVFQASDRGQCPPSRSAVGLDSHDLSYPFFAQGGDLPDPGTAGVAGVPPQVTCGARTGAYKVKITAAFLSLLYVTLLFLLFGLFATVMFGS